MPKFVLIFYIYSSNHSLPRFWFYLRYTNKSTFGLYILSCNPFFYVLYLLLITIHQASFGLTLDINKKKYTKLSVVLFPVVLRVANFLLPYFVQLFPCCVENLLFGYSPPIMQGPSTAHNSVEVLFVVFVCINLLGNVVRVYPRTVQGLTFLSA